MTLKQEMEPSLNSNLRAALQTARKTQYKKDDWWWPGWQKKSPKKETCSYMVYFTLGVIFFKWNTSWLNKNELKNFTIIFFLATIWKICAMKQINQNWEVDEKSFDQMKTTISSATLSTATISNVINSVSRLA